MVLFLYDHWQMDDAEFISISRALDDCWMQDRLEDLRSFLADDVVLVAPGGKPRIIGITEAIESYRQFTTYAEINRFQTSDYAVAWRGDTAVVEYEWEMN
ncbi:MAG: nuclear transport factor 2 family protein, partial [Acidobacteriaceae bacterium]|nr:nuclear transport factor 2 family protein [Acidobacteriaceae bacterium]